MMNATAADAASLLALLEEPDPALVCEALKALDAAVPQAWPEISECLKQLENLVDDPKFAGSQLAALVVSKVYFHMGKQSEALDFALLAGDYFNPIERTPDTDIAYSDCMLRNCVDYYIKVRCEDADSKNEKESVKTISGNIIAITGKFEKLDPRLVTIVETLISDSVKAKDFSLALGLAVDSRRFDLVEDIVNKDLENSDAALDCCRHLALDEVARDALLPRSVKMELLRILVTAYRKKHDACVAAGDETTKYVLQLVNCLTILERSDAVADVLRELIASSTDCNSIKVLTAFQIAFDLCSSAPQSFLNSLISNLEGTGDKPADDSVMKKLLSILSGDLQVDKELNFLFSHNHTDMYLLNTIKASVGKEDSIKHAALVYANSLMHAGTSVDEFIRRNLDFISRANHWAKFATTAGFGVIHKGRHQSSRQILSRYLPSSGGAMRGGDNSEYNEGGALYALGFIHANHGSNIVDYLMDAISNANDSEIKLHGGCLGLGIAAMGTDNDAYYEQLKTIMYAQQSGSVAGEAAGIAMGLVHMGTMTPHIQEMLAYAHQTTHERVCRGLVLGIAIAMLGRQEDADTMIEQLVSDKDPIVRYGGAFAVALAYCGSGLTKATRKLLHIAVTDVSDDVRRAALTGLGFILFKHPHQCPSLVQLLMDSFNPHVRYGAAMALGIACAGTALQSAIDLLEPMTRDSVDFVRQGALIAMGLILVETNKTEMPVLEQFNKRCLEIINNKFESVLSSIGAILAQGLVNAGGRNVTISCATLNGATNMRAVVGLAMFCQYWFWQPYILFASLAMTPTAVIALDSELNGVPLRFMSNVAPSQFVYPEGMKPPEKTTKAKGPTAVLSYGHGKALSKSKSSASSASSEQKEQKDQKEESEESAKKIVKPKEPSSETLSSPCRVTIRQRKYLSFDVDQKYTPVKTGVIHGITLVHDNNPPQPMVTDEPSATSQPKNEEQDDGEVAPPASFELSA